MTEKKDKDIWDKISDAASTAGKAIGDEYQRLRLTHDIWLLDRDLQKAYAKAGKLIHEKHKDEGLPVDDELNPIFDEIEELARSIKNLEEQREAFRATAAASGKKKEGDGDDAEMEFLDDADLPYFCPECGVRIEMPSDKRPKHCIKCGHNLSSG